MTNSFGCLMYKLSSSLSLKLAFKESFIVLSQDRVTSKNSLHKNLCAQNLEFLLLVDFEGGKYNYMNFTFKQVCLKKKET